MKEYVKKISEETKERLRRASALKLPDHPTAVGMKPDDIKRALWQPYLGDGTSLLAEQNRIVQETNEALGRVEGRIDTERLDRLMEKVEILKGQEAQDARINALGVQLSGKAKSYVISDVAGLAELLGGAWVSGGYRFDAKDLQTGDNVLIVEEEIPDFWFEATSDPLRADTLSYRDADGTEHEILLSVREAGSDYVQLGVLHPLESDYTVIEGHALSAQKAAEDAKIAERRISLLGERLENLLEEVEAASSENTSTVLFHDFLTLYRVISASASPEETGYLELERLRDGDILRVCEDGVSDFWFEADADTSTLYRYGDTEYPLTVYGMGGVGVIGCLHPIRDAARAKKTYVFPTFLSFYNFIAMGEETEVGGVRIDSTDLRDGDCVRVLESGVPSFWYEKNTSASTDYYTYGGRTYSLHVCGLYGMEAFGMMHPMGADLSGVEAALDAILQVQNGLIGGDGA